MAVITGNNVSNFLQGTGNADLIEGLGGSDTIFGYSGNDELRGGEGDDQLYGGDQDDLLEGGEGADRLDGQLGVNVLRGGGGDDMLRAVSNIAGEYLDGGSGIDELEFSAQYLGAGVTFSLADPAVTQIVGGATVLNVERINFTGSDNHSDSITGGALDDRIVGLGGADTIDGGAGNDIIDGGGTGDSIQGGGGDDLIWQRGAEALIDGGAGIDLLRITYGEVASIDFTDPSVAQSLGVTTIRNVERIEFSGSHNDNRVVGGAYADIIDGNGGDDWLEGGGGNDDLSGGEGTDILWGGAGDDVIRNVEMTNTLGIALIDGGEGTDTAELWVRNYSGNIVIDLADPGGLVRNVEQFAFSGGSGMNTVRAGAGADTLIGGASVDRFEGGAGNDQIDGREGDDHIAGGSGDDYLVGFSGYDTLYGGDDHDTLIAGAGGGYFDGGAGDDILRGYFGADTLVGGAGNDVIEGAEGDDRAAFVYAGPATATLQIVPSEYGDIRDFDIFQLTTVSGPGWTGTDRALVFRVTFSGDSATVTGYGPAAGLGADVVTGVETLRFAIDGGAWAHVGPLATVAGGAGTDSLVGTMGRDTIAGLGGDDRLEGFGGSDTIAGGDGNDVLLSGSGTDRLIGGAGDDVLFFGADFDMEDGRDGGDGNDLLVLQGSYAMAWSGAMDVFPNIEGLLLLSKDDPRFNGQTPSDTYYDIQLRSDQIVDAGGTFLVDGSGLTGGLRFFGGGETDGAFRILGGAGADVVTGGGGNDQFLGGAGNDSMTGLGGDDSYFVDSVDDEIVEEPGGGNDTVTSSAAAFHLDSNVETLILTGAAILGAGNGGANRLVGTSASNALQGLGGDDVLDGGAGADQMDGGAGNDVYHVDQAGDVVTENAGEGIDEIRTGLAAFSLAGLANVEALTGTSNSGQSLTGNGAANIVKAGTGNDFIFLQAGGDDDAQGNAGNDVFLFGASMNAMDLIDGGSGTDQIALQGDYSGAAALVLGSNFVSVENIALLAGSDTRFGDPGTNLYDYAIGTTDAALAPGVQLVVDASALRPGEDLTFNGSAETDGSFFIYGGRGVDNLTGGAKNDVFIFGHDGQWGSGDSLVGGAGIDQLALRGSYTITFGAGQLSGIEQIGMVSAQDTRYGALGSSYSYDLTMVDSNVVSIQMTLDAGLLRSNETLTFNGSAEDDGSFRVFGGLGNDSIAGSQTGDVLVGNGGADSLTGGAGADVFRYVSAADSSAGARDHILDFLSGTDKIDLGRIDSNSLAAGDQAFSWIGSQAFSGTAGQLRAYQQGGTWFVEGDVDGNAGADFVIMLTLQGQSPPGVGDFIL